MYVILDYFSCKCGKWFINILKYILEVESCIRIQKYHIVKKNDRELI